MSMRYYFVENNNEFSLVWILKHYQINKMEY